MTDPLQLARECGASVHDRYEYTLPVAQEVRFPDDASFAAFVSRVRAEAMREQRRVKLSDYVNGADILASDMPHTVLEKLQRSLDAAIAQQQQEGTK